MCVLVGSLPSLADDVITLKGQVHMLQTQLLFERHRREMHVKRNRGQLRHVLNAAKFEIENTNLVGIYFSIWRMEQHEPVSRLYKSAVKLFVVCTTLICSV